MDRAWYDVKKPGLSRNIWVILHPQYSAWFIAYVVMGAAIAPVLNWGLLGWTVLAFTLGMVIAAHFLDETHGRPLQTNFPSWLLWTIASLSLLVTFAIALLLTSRLGPWLWSFWAFAVWGVLAYNLEKPRWMHSDIAFSVLWGAFPTLSAFWIQTQSISWPAIGLALFALLTAYVQRVLSMQSRKIRRKLGGIEISTDYIPGASGSVDEDWDWVNKAFFLKPVDMALKLMNAAIVALAVALLVDRI